MPGFKYSIVSVILSTIIIQAMTVLNYFELISTLPQKNLSFSYNIYRPLEALDFFFIAVFSAPILEEFIFRLVPIELSKKMPTKNFRIIQWLTIIISSGLFGYAHGTWHFVFIIGISGMVFSAAYIKMGYIGSIIAHSGHNFIVIFILTIKSIIL